MRDTRTGQIGRDEEGLVIVRIKAGVSQSLTDATDNLTAAVLETEGQRRPLLIDVRNAEPLDADARHHYSGQVLTDHFVALALLVDATPFGRMMGNVYLRIARPGIPTQLFTDETDAVRWLRESRA
jgi:hypothetical protein